MLQHLYLIDYSSRKITSNGTKEKSFISALHTNIMMYAMGEEYDIPDLKKEALSKFEYALNAAMNTNLELNDRLAFVLKCVPTIYTTTPDSDRGLRDLVVALGAEHLDQMKHLPSFKDVVTQLPIYIIEVLPLCDCSLRRKW